MWEEHLWIKQGVGASLKATVLLVTSRGYMAPPFLERKKSKGWRIFKSFSVSPSKKVRVDYCRKFATEIAEAFDRLLQHSSLS